MFNCNIFIFPCNIVVDIHNFSSQHKSENCLNKIYIFQTTRFNHTMIFFKLIEIDSYNSRYFKIIDKATFKFDLKVKEALHINWRKPKYTTIHIFQSNQIKFENPKFSVPLKRFIVRFLTTLNSRKP